ncbi:MAG TPA: hypothetical protein VG734_05390 [Lacunisphaera sp.]|nr:hypothetical protein [Lacunisphaera sp.]
MKLRRFAMLLLVAGLAGLPAARASDWAVIEFDGRADWVRYDFVGWVRVEQPVKPAKFAKGTAAVTVKVIEKLSGDEAAPVLTLEYEAAPKKGGEDPVARHRWNEDLPEHREYFVFLNRLGNGSYWCDEQREFQVRDGRILGLPEAYTVLVGGDTKPGARDLMARVRMASPAFKVRTGRPVFAPPLLEKGRPLETPQQAFERVRIALQAGDARELDRLIHSPDGSEPKAFRAVLLQERQRIGAWPVRWQAVLEDKAVAIIGQPGETGAPLYFTRQGPRWRLLNTSPDTEVGRQQVNLLMTESQFAVLTAMLEREFRSGVGAAGAP